MVPELAEWVAGLLATGTVHGFAADAPDRAPLGGRGEAWRIRAPAPSRAQAWVVRHYVRGGAVAGPVLGDRYLRLGVPRPLAELRASERARARGVRTPRVLVAAWYARGPFARGDLVSEWIDGAFDLAALLFGGTEGSPTAMPEIPPPDRDQALAAAGGLVRSLTMAGVEHVDLNATNIALRPTSAGLEAWALDLDRALIHPEPVVSAGVRMRDRLERSLAKLGAAPSARPLTPAELARFRDAAGDPREAVSAATARNSG
ncbi:MAG: lipopolysaccharide kinase InaA family protein [Gemmatimonadota bacterium]